MRLLPLFLILSLLFSVAAVSQDRCAEGFSDKARWVGEHGKPSAAEMSAATLRSIAKLESGVASMKQVAGKFSDENQVLNPLESVEARAVLVLTQAYLDAAGISYTSKPVKRVYRNELSPLNEMEFTYNVFVLNGVTKITDDFSASLLGVLLSPTAQSIEIVLDPFMGTVFYPGVSAKWLNGQILLGIGTLIATLKQSSFSLLHEFIHAKEEFKVSAGEFSLAAVTTEGYLEDFTYAPKLRWDELETHIRDLRRYWSQSDALRQANQRVYEKKVMNMAENLKMAKLGLGVLEQIVEQHLQPVAITAGNQGESVFTFEFLGDSDPFTSVSFISMVGIESLPEFLIKARVRIDEINAEFSRRVPAPVGWSSP